MYFLPLLSPITRKKEKSNDGPISLRVSPPTHSHAPGWAEKTEAFRHFSNCDTYPIIASTRSRTMTFKKTLFHSNNSQHTNNQYSPMSYVKFVCRMGVPARASSFHRLQPTTEANTMWTNLQYYTNSLLTVLNKLFLETLVIFC